MLPCRLPPSELVGFAVAAEQAGLDQLWVVEDAFFAGGIATAATALAVTRSMTIGVGIVPAAARNVAYLAMEVATLAELHPDRVWFGVGHGMLSWLDQVGSRPASPLTLLEETLEALRVLLRGDEVTREGRYVQLDRVRLEFPPRVVPPVLAGVRGPRSIAIAGRAADGTILAEPTGTAYVADADGRVRAAAETAGVREGHELVAYTWFRPGPDTESTRSVARRLLAETLGPVNRPHLVPMIGGAELAEALAGCSTAGERAAMLDDARVDELVVHGSTDDAFRAVRALADHGAGTVVLIPPPGEELDAIHHAGRLARRLGWAASSVPLGTAGSLD